MKNITNVKISSRRSSNIDKEYITYEMTLEASVTGMSEEEREKQIQEMYDYADNLVDDKIASAIADLKRGQKK